MSERVDYDSIAPSYNHRFEGESRSGTFLAIQKLAQDLSAEWILEVGCGTGHWLAGLADAPHRLYGLDYSAGMLAQAHRASQTLSLVQGRAEELPFPAGAFDLVYCVNAIHHFQGQRDFVRQARKLLRPGGALAVTGMDPRGHRQDWYVYDYFAGVYETDLARFPSWNMVMDWMTEAGFERIEFDQVDEEGAPMYGRAVLEDPFLIKSSCSQLALLSAQSYATGLERIQRALEEAETQGIPQVFQDTIRIHQLVGWLKSK